jgi:rare lipoprotein A
MTRSIARLLVLLAVIGALAACVSSAPAPVTRRPAPVVPQDGPPASAPVDLANLPDPVPKPEPRSRYGNPEQYTVAGKTYRILRSAAGYAENGMASWYGTKFHGRRTSSGEAYDMLQLTAAHKTLPIPTYAHVINLDNGRRSIVRINDRGPFHEGRIIDLSYAAAVKLGVHPAGTARVRVEAISFDPAVSGGRYVLQAGAFSALEAADALHARLKSLVQHPVHVVQTPEDHLYRVRIGPIHGDAELDRVRALFEEHALGAPMLVNGG